MTSTQAFNYIVQTLLDIYDPGETLSIAAIVLEDAFSIPPRRISENIKLEKEQQLQLDTILDRLLKHEPVQYVMGHTIFCGLKIKVTPAVLIPRQETEETVQWVLEAVATRQSIAGSPAKPMRILDIGTGSGCIPVALKKKRPGLEVHALDISTAALDIAAGNARMNTVEVHFHEVDILDKKAWKALPVFDLIVSNPPYVTQKERIILPKNVIDYEPHLALFAGGNDAQRFVKKIAEFGQTHLSPGGWLYLETNEFYVPKSTEILQGKGYTQVEVQQDLNKKDRMIRGRRGIGILRY